MSLILLLGLEPVGQGGGSTGSLGSGILALNLDGHGLVLLEAAGEVALLRGLGGGWGGEGLNLADGVGLSDRRDLVGLQLLEIELLDEIGCEREGRSVSEFPSSMYD